MGSSSCSSSCPLLIPGLPDDVGVQCLARVPRLFHPTLSLVCRSWNSLLRSQLFFSTRSFLQAAQPFLCLLVRTHDTTSSLSWFALHHHDNFRHIFSLPLMPSTPVGAACAVLGTRLFVLGGSVNEIPTHTVWIYDAVLNRWEAGPNMRVAREFAATGEIDGKIYVVGGCQPDSWSRSNSWAEVFDPRVGAWAPVPSPIEMRDKWMHGNAVLDGKLLAVADRGGVAYDPRNCSWSYVSCELDSGWRGRAAVVGGILYCYDYLGKIRGFDPDDSQWKKLKGVKKMLPKFLCGATMANVGGKLFVVWEGNGSAGKYKGTELFCAEIEVCKQESGKLQGSIVWTQVIISLSRGASIVQCLALAL
ncbi:unnamed protein product [Victoria cruziana]